MAGPRVTGYNFNRNRKTGQTDPKRPDPSADAIRVPALMLIDASQSMAPSKDTLQNAAKHMIEACAASPVAKGRIDLEVLTFNTEINSHVNIAFEELYKMVDRSGKIKPEYEKMLEINCTGGTPTGFALADALNDLLDRTNRLEKAGKSPMMPVLFFISDGRPEVYEAEQNEHDRLLDETIKKIRDMVSKNHLSVIAVEAGLLCETPRNAEDRAIIQKMQKLMRDITGLDDDRHIRKAKDGDDLTEFFEFTSSLLISRSQPGTSQASLNDQNVSNFKSELNNR